MHQLLFSPPPSVMKEKTCVQQNTERLFDLLPVVTCVIKLSKGQTTLNTNCMLGILAVACSKN